MPGWIIITQDYVCLREKAEGVVELLINEVARYKPRVSALCVCLAKEDSSDRYI